MCCLAESTIQSACFVLKLFIAILLLLQMVFGVVITLGGAYVFREAAPMKPEHQPNDDITLQSSLALFNYASEVRDFSQTSLAKACAIMMVSGVVFAGIGVVGFSSVTSGKPKILLVFLAMLVVSSTLATYIATQFKAHKDKAAMAALEVMEWSLETQYDGNLNSSNRFSRLWDIGHITFGCCGINNASDFERAARFDKTYLGPEVGFTGMNGTYHNLSIPVSCCRMAPEFHKVNFLKFLASREHNDKSQLLLNDTSCLETPTETNSFKNLGCLEYLESQITKYSSLISGVSSATFSTQVVLQLGIIGLIYASFI